MKTYERCPLWTLSSSGVIIGFDLKATALARLHGVDMQCAHPDTRYAFSQRVARAIAQCSPHTILRLYSHRQPVEPQDLHWIGEENAIQAQCNNQILKDPNLCRNTIMLAVSTPAQNPHVMLNTSALWKGHKAIQSQAQSFHHQMHNDVEGRIQTLLASIHAAGIRSERIQTQSNVLKTLCGIAKPWEASNIHRPSFRPDISLRSQIFNHVVQNSATHFETSNIRVCVLSLHHAPTVTWSCMMEHMQSAPFPHLLCTSIRRLDDVEAKKRAHSARRVGMEWDHVLAYVRGARQHEQAPDHDVLKQQSDTNSILSALAHGDVLCDVSVQMVLWDTSPDGLFQKTQQALRLINECGDASLCAEDLRHFDAMVQMVPGCDQNIPERTHAFLASRAADLCPMFESPQGAQQATAILSTATGQLYRFHPFNPELPAWNATVAGSTGSGKSFAVKCLLNGWASANGRVVVITRGQDYDRWISVFDGVHQTLHPHHVDLALCPWGYDLEIHGALVRSVLELMIDGGENILTRDMRDVLQSALKEFSTHPEDKRTWEHWFAILEQRGPHGVRIRERMAYWINGPWGEALQRKPKHDMHHRIAWDISPIEDDETRALILGCLALSIAHSVAQGPTVIVMDEVWSLLSSDAGSRLVENLYRTVRKAGSGIWSISQSMGDFSALPRRTRSAILNNATFRFFLRHDKSDAMLVTQEFGLHSEEHKALDALESKPGQYSQLLLQCAGQSLVLNMKPTPFEYWIATSHPKDMVKWSQHQETSLWTKLYDLAKRYPQGAIHDHGVAA